MYFTRSKIEYFKNLLPLEFVEYCDNHLIFYGIFGIGYYYLDDNIFIFLCKKINTDINELK